MKPFLIVAVAAFAAAVAAPALAQDPTPGDTPAYPPDPFPTRRVTEPRDVPAPPEPPRDTRQPDHFAHDQQALPPEQMGVLGIPWWLWFAFGLALAVLVGALALRAGADALARDRVGGPPGGG